MAERTIVGVDFSGAQADNATGITAATLSGNELNIQNCGTIKRDDLTKSLKVLRNDSVVGLDFPFGVPKAFAEELAGAEGLEIPVQMPDLWSIVHNMDERYNGEGYNRFKQICEDFVNRHGQIHRRNDLILKRPKSPLKTKGAPIMSLMTFRGMQMLHLLRQGGCRVPPLQDGDCKGPTLLETMPGVLLQLFGLPYEKYKRTSNSKQLARKNSETILTGLEKGESGLTVRNLDPFWEKCATDDNCLDSLVAAIGAASWAEQSESPYAQLEGWIYAPQR